MCGELLKEPHEQSDGIASPFDGLATFAWKRRSGDPNPRMYGVVSLGLTERNFLQEAISRRLMSGSGSPDKNVYERLGFRAELGCMDSAAEDPVDSTQQVHRIYIRAKISTRDRVAG